MPPIAVAITGHCRWCCCGYGCSGCICRRWKAFSLIAPIPSGLRFWWRCSACIIWRASASGSDVPELRPHRLRDILPPVIESERRLDGWRFERPHDPVGINAVAGSPLNQHDGAAMDQFLEARMVIELARPGRTGDDHGPPGLHAGENTGAPRRDALFERVTERVDLVEQSEHLVIGGDVAADD